MIGSVLTGYERKGESMADRIEVMDALERCNSYGMCDDEGCPYYPTLGCLELLRKDALELLKEQKAKAIEYNDNPFTGLPVAHCPNCKRYAIQFHSSIEEETHYCPWCGHAVKWE